MSLHPLFDLLTKNPYNIPIYFGVFFVTQIFTYILKKKHLEFVIKYDNSEIIAIHRLLTFFIGNCILIINIFITITLYIYYKPIYFKYADLVFYSFLGFCILCLISHGKFLNKIWLNEKNIKNFFFKVPTFYLTFSIIITFTGLISSVVSVLFDSPFHSMYIFIHSGIIFLICLNNCNLFQKFLSSKSNFTKSFSLCFSQPQH